MNQYLSDTQFASQKLIEAIYGEEKHLSQLKKEFDNLKEHISHLENTDLHEDFNEIQVQHNFAQKHKLMPDLSQKENKLRDIELSLSNIKDSLDALSMCLLQIAKQGISTVYGGFSNCPDGRNIGNETLKNIIWQGRNQAIHHEEGNPHPKVKECFANLHIAFGNDYDIETNNNANKAKIIVDLLEWKTYEAYEKDMKELLR